jgi:UDP-N-acetyl-D-mannosaminuronate dehydrogenase
MSVIVGMGEIGSTFYGILSKTEKTVVGIDLDKTKCKNKDYSEFVDVLHICIPSISFESFKNSVVKYTEKYGPHEIVIHSSVEPETTERIQKILAGVPIIYSPFRGIHSRMATDMKRYTKYWAGSATPRLFLNQMERAGIPTAKWPDSPRSLELAKLLMDVTYYGWLIIFAQHAKVLADRFGVDDKKLWLFTEEIHRFLSNRPRMVSGEERRVEDGNAQLRELAARRGRRPRAGLRRTGRAGVR